MTGQTFSDIHPSPNYSSQKGWAIIGLTIALVWAIIIAWLLVIPTDPKNQALFGYSLIRLALIGASILPLLFSLALTWVAYTKPALRLRFLDAWVCQKSRFSIATFILASLAISLWLGAFLFKNFTHPVLVYEKYSYYYERLFPVLIGIFFTAIILLFGLLVLRKGIESQLIAKDLPFWRLTALIFLACLILWGFIALTRIGLIPDQVGWGDIGIPILFYQLLLSSLAGIGLLVLDSILSKHINHWGNLFIDILLCLILWYFAVNTWSKLDIPRSYFAPSPKPPNFEIYPYSDAGFYDYGAQSLLLGYGFLNGKVVPRPLYILLLAGFHRIAGQDYGRTIYIQTLFLALLPVALYLTGKTLHSRGLGFSLGLLSIAREVNSILATPWVEVSHSKLLMADLATTLAVVILSWLTIRWLLHPYQKMTSALIVGGALGVAALFRTQALIFLPALIFLSFLTYWPSWKGMLKTSFLLILGLTLVISPWLVRNRVVSGSLVLDDPATQSAMIAQRYSTNIANMPARQPGESEGEYAIRLSQSIRQFAIANPGFVTQFVSAHTLNNFISAVLILPMRFSVDESCDTLEVCTPFWVGLLEKFSPLDAFFLTINLFLLAVGIASSYKRLGLAGLVPLIFFTLYSLSNAIARNSARRYILPVDWVSYLYVLVGLFELGILSAQFFRLAMTPSNKIVVTMDEQNETHPSHFSWGKMLLSSLVLFLIGLSLPISEIAIKPHYKNFSSAELAEIIKQKTGLLNFQLSSDDLDYFLQQPESFIAEGYIFYPKYYRPGQGEPGQGWLAYKPYQYRPIGKIGFVFLNGQDQFQVNLALEEAPDYFPNATRAIIIGCKEDGYIDALMAIFLDDSDQMIVRSKTNQLNCPMR